MANLALAGEIKFAGESEPSHVRLANATSPAAAEPVVPSGVPGPILDGLTDGMDLGMFEAGCSTCTSSDGLFACGGCGQCEPGIWFADAWLAHGVTVNGHDPASGLSTPLTFNDFANNYQLNQLYLSLGRRVSNCGYWDVGGRVDLLFGTDYFFTTAAGLETHEDGSPRWNSGNGPRAGGAARYGLAMPQLYAEFSAPLGSGLNVKVGHFYSTFGYESVMAPENFFYSHSYTMQYGEPFTHTGLLFETQLSPLVQAHAAVTRGWDNWEDVNGRGAFLGGFALASPDRSRNLAFALFSGNEDTDGVNNRTVYSIVYSRKVTPCLTHVIQHDFGTEANAAINRNFGRDSAKWYGLTNYFIARLSPTSSAGIRVEWFRDQENARVLGIPIAADVSGGNYVEITAGLNLAPRSYMVFRPEIRWDWSDAAATGLGRTGMYNDFRDDSQFTAAADMIIRY
jgi:hypothetical protein